jgi:hypothetical protein
MKSRIGTRAGGLGRAAHKGLVVCASFALATLLPAGSRAQKADAPAAAGGGLVARVLPPAEKLKVLEEELAKETDRRGKVEEESARRLVENNELSASLKNAARERAAVEARLVEARERETNLQRASDRLREENERVTVSVRIALPIIAAVSVMVLGMLVWIFLFLRQIAARVHGTRTLAEMQALQAQLAHANDLINAEAKRSQTLKHKLADLGITD